MIHTRYALQVIRTLFHSDLLTLDDISWFNPVAILDYIKESITTKGGFAIAPGYEPTLYTTRAALNIMKMLEILRCKHIYSANNNYLRIRDGLLKLLVDVDRYIEECRASYGYRDWRRDLINFG